MIKSAEPGKSLYHFAYNYYDNGYFLFECTFVRDADKTYCYIKEKHAKAETLVFKYNLYKTEKEAFRKYKKFLKADLNIHKIAVERIEELLKKTQF